MPTLIGTGAILTGRTLSPSYTMSATGSNRILIAFFSGDSDVTAVTYNGTSMTKQGSSITALGFIAPRLLSQWTLANPASGSNAFAVTGPTADSCWGAACGFSDAEQGAAPTEDTDGNANGGTSERTMTLTMTGSNITVGLIYHDGADGEATESDTQIAVQARDGTWPGIPGMNLQYGDATISWTVAFSAALCIGMTLVHTSSATASLIAVTPALRYAPFLVR